MIMKRILEYTLITIGNFELKVVSAASLLLFIGFIFVLLKLIKKSIYRFHRFDDAKKYSIYSLIKYFIIILSIIISLQIVGFNLSILVAGSAALLVGLGLGIQNLFSDYISGIIILIDSSIKVGDIIEVNGITCKVQEIQLRTTKVLTRDDKNIILPNTDLTRNHVINWTLNEEASRFEIEVGVDYSSDIHLVMQLIQDAGKNTDGVLATPEPFVRFNDFADSSLIFTVYFWAEDVFRVENIKSDLRVRIFEAFKENNITIPFPQRVIHNAS